MCYSSNLPIFKLDIFLHKAFGILRRYTACFPPLQAAAMNDWSESTYRGYPRTYLCLSFLSLFLSLISFFLFVSLPVMSERLGAGNRGRARGERRVPSAFDRGSRRRRRYAGNTRERAAERIPPACWTQNRPSFKLSVHKQFTVLIHHTSQSRLRDPSRTKDRPTLRPKVHQGYGVEDIAL